MKKFFATLAMTVMIAITADATNSWPTSASMYPTIPSRPVSKHMVQTKALSWTEPVEYWPVEYWPGN